MPDPLTAAVTIVGIISSLLSTVERAGSMLKRIKKGEPITDEEIDSLEAEKEAADAAWAKKLKELRAQARNEPVPDEDDEDDEADPTGSPPQPDTGSPPSSGEPGDDGGNPPQPQPLFG